MASLQHCSEVRPHAVQTSPKLSGRGTCCCHRGVGNNETFFIRCGIFLILEKLRHHLSATSSRLCELTTPTRNLFKTV
ncbi:unnamed protein product [Arctogadus glacialis]